GHTLQVAGVRTGDSLEDEEGVFDAASHGAEFVERPAKGHRAGAGNAAVSGTQAGDAAPHAGRNDGAAGFAADGKTDKPRRGGGAGTSARAGSAFFKQPGTDGLAAEPDIVEREGAEAEFRDHHRACGVEALDDGGIFFGNAVAERFGAVSGGDSGGV